MQERQEGPPRRAWMREENLPVANQEKKEAGCGARGIIGLTEEPHDAPYEHRSLLVEIDEVGEKGLALAAVAILLFLRVPLQPKLNQALHQFRIIDARRCPHFGIHADRRKAGNGVDFVDIHLAAAWV